MKLRAAIGRREAPRRITTSSMRACSYDLELDTERDLDANVDRVLAAWAEPPRRSAFFASGAVE